MLNTGNSIWNVTDVYIHSDHRLIFWDVSREKRGPVPKKTISRGWETRAFDLELFKVALNGRRLDAHIARGEAEEEGAGCCLWPYNASEEPYKCKPAGLLV